MPSRGGDEDHGNLTGASTVGTWLVPPIKRAPAWGTGYRPSHLEMAVRPPQNHHDSTGIEDFLFFLGVCRLEFRSLKASLVLR
jgi:hypothetical protein